MQGRRRKARNPRFSNRLNGVLQLAATNGNGIAREKVLKPGIHAGTLSLWLQRSLRRCLRLSFCLISDKTLDHPSVTPGRSFEVIYQMQTMH